jgi:hypothetical protein
MDADEYKRMNNTMDRAILEINQRHAKELFLKELEALPIREDKKSS